MKLIFVRHGDAFAGLRGVIPGPLGCLGLTDLGRRQAQALHDSIAADPDFSVDVLVTSMLPRAIETAGIIAPALGFAEVPQDCDLCEVHTGEADGLDWADYASRFGTVDMLAEPHRPSLREATAGTASTTGSDWRWTASPVTIPARP